MSDTPTDDRSGDQGDDDLLDDLEAPGISLVEDDDAVPPPEPNEPA